MKETDDIERLFQESFEDFEATPPASVKIAIDRAIAHKHRRIWWLFAVLFLLTTTLLTGFFLFDTETIQKSEQPQMAGKSHTQENLPPRSDYSENSKKYDQTAKAGSSGTVANQTNQDESENRQLIDSAKKWAYTKQSDQRILANEKTTRSVKPKASAKTGKTKKTGKTERPSDGKSSGAVNGTGENNASGNILAAGAAQGNTNSSSDEASSSTTRSNETARQTEETKPANEPVAKATDSLAAHLPDSTAKGTSPVLQNVNQNNTASKWMASLYLGPQFDPQTGNKGLQIAPSFRPSVEINRSLIAGYGLNTGIGYNAQHEKYTFESTTISTYTTVDSIPVYHPVDTDSIIGYQHYTVYDQDTAITSRTVSSRVSTVFIPVYVTKHFEFGQKWGLLVNAGAVFRISTIKAGSTSPEEPEPIQYKTGIMLSGRLHGTYRMGSWMFSAGLNCGYYVKPPLEYHGMDKSRYFLSPQVGLHYKF